MKPDEQPGIKFAGVDLLRLSFAVKGPLPEKIPLGPTFALEAHLSDDNRTLDLLLTIDLFGSVEEEEKPPVDLNFALHGRFTATEESSMSLEEFAKHQAPAHLIPYVRELIASVTTRSILPTLNLGPINVVALVKSGEASFEVTARRKDSQEV